MIGKRSSKVYRWRVEPGSSQESGLGVTVSFAALFPTAHTTKTPPLPRPTVQIAGQTAFFVALFRQATRERLFAVLERVAPHGLPLLHLNGLTPAQVGSCRHKGWAHVGACGGG